MKVELPYTQEDKIIELLKYPLFRELVTRFELEIDFTKNENTV